MNWISHYFKVQRLCGQNKGSLVKWHSGSGNFVTKGNKVIGLDTWSSGLLLLLVIPLVLKVSWYCWFGVWFCCCCCSCICCDMDDLTDDDCREISTGPWVNPCKFGFLIIPISLLSVEPCCRPVCCDWSEDDDDTNDDGITKECASAFMEGVDWNENITIITAAARVGIITTNTGVSIGKNPTLNFIFGILKELGFWLYFGFRGYVRTIYSVSL